MRDVFYPILLLLCSFTPFSLQSQVAITPDGTGPHASAVLELKSTDKGILVPRMMSSDRTMIAAPAPGLLVYDLTTESFWFYTGMEWKELISGYIDKIRDADNDTKIQVEESTNEDIIRFDIAGSEKMVLQSNTNDIVRLDFDDDGLNTLIGDNAGQNMGASALENTMIGANAGNNATVGIYNTGVGSHTLTSVSSNFNTALGAWALRHTTTGSKNTALGSGTLTTNITGMENVAVGYQALNSNNGNRNSAMGYWANLNNISGSDNTSCGSEALLFATNSENTAVGSSAGTDSDNSTGCTYLGYDADNDDHNNTYTNSTVIGRTARMTASNQVRIGNNEVTSIGGFANWSNVSDSRFKINVVENVPGLSFIQLLRPITYHLDVHALADHINEDKSDVRNPEAENAPSPVILQARDEKASAIISGFIAQEVEQAAQSIGYEFSGVDAPKNQTDFYALRYAEFVVPLVKAVQELNTQNQQLLEMITSLQTEITSLKSND